MGFSAMHLFQPTLAELKLGSFKVFTHGEYSEIETIPSWMYQIFKSEV
jgi:hypothetical protein